MKTEKFEQLGFSTFDKSDCLFHPVHRLQFADDAAVMRSGEKDNQLLLNCFTTWKNALLLVSSNFLLALSNISLLS